MDWRNALIVGLIVTAFGGLLAHRLALRRDQQSARRAAAKDFRTAVLGELTDLYPLPVNWPDNIDERLRRAFPILQNAVAQFRPSVSFLRRWAFDRAWFKYRCGTGREIDLQNYHHYITFGSNPEAKTNFNKNVTRLLSFAYC